MKRLAAVMVPLGCYFFVNLGLPMLHGVGASSEFGAHAVEVVVAALITAIPFVVSVAARRQSRRMVCAVVSPPRSS